MIHIDEARAARHRGRGVLLASPVECSWCHRRRAYWHGEAGGQIVYLCEPCAEVRVNQ